MGEGYLDGFDDGAVFGWAIDPADPARTAQVVVLCGDEVLGEVSAAQPREDLRQAGIGSGHGQYGFRFQVPNHVRARGDYFLRAVCGGVELHGSPLWVSDPAAAQAPSNFLDSVDAGVAFGWAMDPADPSRPAEVTLHFGDECVARALASDYREDLKQSSVGLGHGRYGFHCRIPDRIRALGEYTLRALCGGVELNGSPIEVSEPRAVPLPANFIEVREAIARLYLSGRGIEIGALNQPLRVPAGCTVRHVDAKSTAELRRSYEQEMAGFDIVDVDVVCDAQTLAAVPDESEDFLIANQVFEHLEDPLLGLRNFLRVIRRGGCVFLTIPEKRFTFDADRPSTPFAHLLEDYVFGPERSRESHYREWVELVEKVPKAESGPRLEELMNRLHYSIHFHVWTQSDMLAMLLEARGLPGLAFEIDGFKANQCEAIIVLRKS